MSEIVLFFFNKKITLDRCIAASFEVYEGQMSCGGRESHFHVQCLGV